MKIWTFIFGVSFLVTLFGCTNSFKSSTDPMAGDLSNGPAAPTPDPSPSSSSTGGLITNFTSIPDRYFEIDGVSYGVDTAGKSYSLTEIDDHTLRFEIQKGDNASNIGDPNTLERSEIDGGGRLFAPATSVSINYQFMLEPGAANTASWFVTAEMHSYDPDSFNGSWLPGTSPPFAVQLAGEHLNVVARYCPSNLDPSNSAGNLTMLNLWTQSTAIVRGQWYDIKIESSVINTSAGYLYVWVNGTQVVNYNGPLGYGARTYWLNGLYRSTTSQDTAAQFRDITITTP